MRSETLAPSVSVHLRQLVCHGLRCFPCPGRRLRSPYTLVNDRIRCVFRCIRPYFSVLPGSVLRSYISVSYTKKYDHIRRITEQNADCIRSPYTRTVKDRFFLRISSYFSVYDTEIYDRNTEPGKSSCFSVYGRLRPCLFDLGT